MKTVRRILLAAAVGAIVAEVSMRVVLAMGWLGPFLYGPSNPYYVDNSGGTRFVPGFEGFRIFQGRKIPFQTNETGFRSSVPYRTGVPGRPVIAVIGDSFVLASEVPEPETFVKQLEERFRSGGQDVQVQNYGMGGTGLAHYWTRWRTDVMPHHPSVTVLCVFGANDISDLVPELARYGFLVPRYVRDSTGQVADIGRYDPPGVPNALRPLAASLLLHPLLVRRNPKSVSPGYTMGAYFGDGNPLFARAWEDAGAILRHLAAETSTAGSRLVVVWIPYDLELDDARWEEAEKSYRDRRIMRTLPRDRMSELAARAGIPFLDPSEILENAMQGGRDPFLPGDGHFSSEGHRLMAGWLFPELSGFHGASAGH